MTTPAEDLSAAREHHQAGRLQEAEQLYRQVLAADPNHPDAWHLLGVIACQVGNFEPALGCIGRAIQLNGSEAIYHNTLGEALRALGRLTEAITCYHQALHLNPNFAEAHNNLGNALLDQGQIAAALASYQRAVQLQPDYAQAHNNLGNALLNDGQFAAALASYQRALQLRPDLAPSCNGLANALMELGQLDEAIAHYEQALRLRPDYSPALNNLGMALKEQGKLEDAIGCFQSALLFRPDYVKCHSNLLYTLHFCPGYDAETLAAEHRRWNEQHARPLATCLQPHDNDRTPERRLRLGYVSPDFRAHPVGRFLLPLLEAHDHERFEIACYASVPVRDAITERCHARADLWRDVYGVSDEQLAQLIRQDRVDVLVDLTMHMAGSRLLVFARKPAPVQVTYLAYCSTTGLDAIDYRLTDPHLDPPGQDEGIYSEQSIRLPETYWCYLPADTPPVTSLPALQTGAITFGCFNSFSKVTTPTLLAWTRILQALPEARLILHARPGSHRAAVRNLLTQESVSPDRLTFVDTVPVADYFRHYERIDVALDPFPYCGGTTTCDALWMGVPVVSLVGQTAVGRGGKSILSNVGLADLVAADIDQYIGIAVELARDRSRLVELRASLRERMRASPLMDSQRFARNVEAAYRLMWQRWCAGLK